MKARRSRNLVTFDHVFVSQYTAAISPRLRSPILRHPVRSNAVDEVPGDFAPLRKIRPLVVCALLLLTSLSTAWAAGPTLTQQSPFPAECQPHEIQTFHVLYTNPSGDPATDVELIIQTPGGGQAKILGTQPEGTDPGQGITYTFEFSPENVGEYKYHFHCDTSTSQTADSTSAEFTSYSMVTKFIILGIGFVVAMLFVPFIIYVIARAVNKRGNPATAARVGLLIGVIAWYGVFVYLFFTIYSTLTIGLAGVAAVAILVGLLTRR